MKELKNKIEKAGKLDKLALFVKLIKKQCKEKDSEYYKTYKEALKIIEEYLSFDENPPDAICKNLLEIYNYSFKTIRGTGEIENFSEIQDSFFKYEKFFKDNELLALIYSNFNFFSWQQGKLKKALSYGLTSLKYLDKSDNYSIIPGRYSNIGYIYESMGNFSKAEEYYEKTIKFGFKINSDKVKKLAYSGYGRLYLNKGNPKQAVDYLLEAEKYANDKESDDYSSICCNLGIAYGMMKDFQTSLKYFKPFATEKVRKKNPDLYFTSLLNMANCYNISGNHSQAEKNLKKALYFAEKHTLSGDIAGILINLGQLEKKRGDYEKSLKYFFDSKSIIKKNYDLKKDILIEQGIGSIYMILKDYRKAVDYLKSSITKAKEKDLRYEVINSYENLYIIYEKLGKYEYALKYHKLFKEIEKEMNSVQKNEELEFSNESRNTVHKLIPFDSLISSKLAEKVNSPLIGNSNEIRNILYQARLAAENFNMSVLLSGESGTGKEIIARIIHFSSNRSNNPIISVNCPSIAGSLIESSFFGHEQGAYTGADKQVAGYFEAANSGTLFLDEIGDMPLEMQAKFLRVLEEKKINRLGSVNNIEVDFRLISATNKNLKKLIDQDKFRLDLYNRINTLEIHISALRDRKDDIPPLIDYFITKFSHDMNKKKPICSKEALELLMNYNYPGNVRELMNILKKSLLFCKNSVIAPEDILIPQENKYHIKEELDLNLENNEKKLISLAMKKAGNHQINAAKFLGISPSSLSRKLKKNNG